MRYIRGGSEVHMEELGTHGVGSEVSTEEWGTHRGVGYTRSSGIHTEEWGIHGGVG